MTYDPYVEARGRLAPMVEATTRSAKPKVIGILAIIFAGMGMLGSFATVGILSDLHHRHMSFDDLGAYGSWMIASTILGLLISGLHLTAGIQCVRYRASGPKLMTYYAVIALVFILVDVALSFTLFPGRISSRRFDDFVGPRLGLDMLAFAWPIVALVIINTRSARKSCH